MNEAKTRLKYPYVQADTLDKLYLEWSQITRARNRREVRIDKMARQLLLWSEQHIKPIDPNLFNPLKKQIIEIIETAETDGDSVRAEIN